VGRAILTPTNATLHDAVKAIPLEALLTEINSRWPS